ncbi:hypothetical protein O6H91_Y499200 [Diphasiastrum complanatum]|nr:hypothetical protein O6H91_Y499200 [Diphasiastrum complanatum]
MPFLFQLQARAKSYSQWRIILFVWMYLQKMGYLMLICLSATAMLRHRQCHSTIYCSSLERRVLLRANKYSLLTMVAEAVCHLIYPIKWQHVYIPVLFFGGVDYVEAPTPYLMGLHSGVDTSSLSVDGVVVVDLVHNLITTSEDIPSLPELLKELRSGFSNFYIPILLIWIVLARH